MLCDKCGKRQATVHYQQVVNGQAMEQHLCHECAAGFAAFGELDLNKLFSSSVRPARAATCPNCGMSLAEFQTSGRLGCSSCYAAFAEALRPLIKRYHGERRHKGKLKRPLLYQANGLPPDGVLADKTYEKLALQKQLAELVELEKFEEAAKVRDQIRAVEQEIARAAGEAGDLR